MTEIREFRGQFDTKYAALYHPWIEILDPTAARRRQGAPPRRLLLPPSGFVAGIYARSDIERGVHKAPANEVVLGPHPVRDQHQQRPPGRCSTPRASTRCASSRAAATGSGARAR